MKAYIFTKQVGKLFGPVLVHPHRRFHLYFVCLSLKLLVNLPLQPALINLDLTTAIRNDVAYLRAFSRDLSSLT